MSTEDQRLIDSSAVRSVAAVMDAHMAMARMGPRKKEGWQDKTLCDRSYLSVLFFRALKAQRLISAMNYLMMLWFRKEEVDLQQAVPIVPVRDADVQLLKFYNAEDIYGVVDAQEDHIKGLQEKLAKYENPDFKPSAPRA